MNIGFANHKKGDIFTGGYDNQKNITLGYSFRLINNKK